MLYIYYGIVFFNILKKIFLGIYVKTIRNIIICVRFEHAICMEKALYKCTIIIIIIIDINFYYSQDGNENLHIATKTKIAANPRKDGVEKY